MTKKEGRIFYTICYHMAGYGGLDIRGMALDEARNVVKRENKKRTGKKFYYKESKSKKCINIYVK